VNRLPSKRQRLLSFQITIKHKLQKGQIMGNYILAVTLILGWVIGVAEFSAGAGIHLLLFVAMITVAGSQNKQRKVHKAAAKNIAA